MSIEDVNYFMQIKNFFAVFPIKYCLRLAKTAASAEKLATSFKKAFCKKAAKHFTRDEIVYFYAPLENESYKNL